jgi:zinc protease
MMMWILDQFLPALDPRIGALVASFSLASLTFAAAAEKPQVSPRVTEFKLKNGLQVLVIPDHRASVVPRMIWYRVGAGTSREAPPASRIFSSI